LGSRRRVEETLSPRALVVALDQERLLSMSRQQLEDLYASSLAGSIPNGRARGVAIVAPGTRYNRIIARATSLLGWQGKTFDAARGTLVNRITPFRINAIAAEVYSAPSVLDGRECIVLDYSRTSTLARWIRDEIRNIAPDLYFGFAYWGRRPLIGFSLDFTSVDAASSPVR
jgi:hypothetical protein